MVPWRPARVVVMSLHCRRRTTTSLQADLLWCNLHASSCRGSFDPARLSYVDLPSCPWAVVATCSRTKFSNAFQRLSHLYSRTPAAAKDGSECFLESMSPLLHINLACSAELSHVGPASMSCVSQTSSQECRSSCVGLLREPAARWIQGELSCPLLFLLARCAPPRFKRFLVTTFLNSFQLVLCVVAEFLPVVAFCCALSHRLVLPFGCTALPFERSW